MQKPTPILTLLLAWAGSLTAQITADITVSQAAGPLGTITVELDHLNAPMATANFIGLATGKLSWIDSATGVARHNTPYYDGIVFHRVIPNFMNQTGSQNGQGTDGPGYKFQDGQEVINGLDHAEAYKISMANSGIDTNGSQFFLTAVPTTWLDGKHIVFGEVTATGTSRSIVDQINNLPTDAGDRPIDDTWIESVTVNYNGVNFDPSAQGLPVVSTPPLGAPITPSTTTLTFTQPSGSEFHLAYSDDLASWSRATTRILAFDDTPLGSFSIPVAAQGGERKFHSPALVTYNPDFLIPQDLNNRTLTVLVPFYSETVPITFNFNATSTAATWSWPATAESGTAVFFDAYSATLNSAFTTLQMSGSATFGYWRFSRLWPTSSTPTEVSGDCRMFLFDTNGTFIGSQFGTFTLTK